MLPNPLRKPWAITEDGLQLIVAIASRDEFFKEVREQALSARDGKPLDNARTITVREGVATIPVNGPLFRKADMLSAISGATSYATIRKDLQAALENPEVKAVVFDMDSPGGEVAGMVELADAIYAARGTKPLIAYVSGTCASAAYCIASACDEIVTSQTGVLGSIGCVAVFQDTSKKEANEGVQTIEIVSSQSPNKRPDPATEEGRAQLQAQLDDMAAVFIGVVARDRGVSAKDVAEKYGRGGCFIGALACDAGLADRVGSYEGVLTELAAKDKRNMNKIALALGLPESATEEEITVKAEALAKSEKALGEVLRVTGAANADEAIGKVQAGAEALTKNAEMQAEQVKAAAIAVRKDFRGAIEQALSGDKPILTLGELSRVVPTLMDKPEAAEKALETVKEQKAEDILAALCAEEMEISAASLKRVGAYLTAKAPAVPEKSAAEPARDMASEQMDEMEKQIVAAANEARAILDKAKPRK
jgi:signal peptide peptidase SppA